MDESSDLASAGARPADEPLWHWLGVLGTSPGRPLAEPQTRRPAAGVGAAGRGGGRASARRLHARASELGRARPDTRTSTYLVLRSTAWYPGPVLGQ